MQVVFPKLEELDIKSLNIRKISIFGNNTLFPQLEFQVLYDFPNLERFCGGDISFPQLKYLRLADLPNLQRFCGRDCVDCPFLSRLTISDCLKLRVSITEKDDENSRSSVDKQHLSHHKVILIYFS